MDIASQSEFNRLHDVFYSCVMVPDSPDGCWVWVGERHYSRSPLFPFPKDETGKRVLQGAVRVAYYFEHRRFPTYSVSLCKNDFCVNLDHHRFTDPLTKEEATVRRVRKHRAPGSSSFLTDDEALAIRHAVKRGESEKELATQYGVAQRAISRVARGDTFQHVGGPRRSPINRSIKEFHSDWLYDLDIAASGKVSPSPPPPVMRQREPRRTELPAGGYSQLPRPNWAPAVGMFTSHRRGNIKP